MTKLNIINKDILTVEKGIIVQQVNAIGKTGAGLSGAINAKYPQVKEHYLEEFKYGLPLGKVLYTNVGSMLWVLSIVGQQNVGTYKVQTNFSALRQGLNKVAQFAKEAEVDTFIPYLLGSSLAGGPTQQTKQETWNKVSSIIWEEIPDAIICRKV